MAMLQGAAFLAVTQEVGTSYCVIKASAASAPGWHRLGASAVARCGETDLRRQSGPGLELPEAGAAGSAIPTAAAEIDAASEVMSADLGAGAAGERPAGPGEARVLVPRDFGSAKVTGMQWFLGLLPVGARGL